MSEISAIFRFDIPDTSNEFREYLYSQFSLSTKTEDLIEYFVKHCYEI